MVDINIANTCDTPECNADTIGLFLLPQTLAHETVQRGRIDTVIRFDGRELAQAGSVRTNPASLRDQSRARCRTGLKSNRGILEHHALGHVFTGDAKLVGCGQIGRRVRLVFVRISPQT